MKFYEYSNKNHSPYYALIAANSEESANGEYSKKVCEIDNDFLGASEVTEKQARDLFNLGKAEPGTPDIGFDEAVKQLPALLLIEGSLA
jgi:hypothetical protein